jgi:hypothetical protein
MVMTIEQSTKIVGMIYGARGQVPENLVIASWHDSIKEIDYGLAVHAAKIYKSTDGEFRDVARYLDVVSSLVNAPAPSTMEALAEVRSAIIWNGTTTMPEFTNPYIERAIGGLTNWRAWGLSEDNYWEHDFKRSYEAVVARRSFEQKLQLSMGETPAFLQELTRKFDAGAIGQG